MSKFVSFPLQTEDVRIVYPDDISLFSDTVVDGETIHARYFGDLNFAPSDYFHQKLLASVVINIKQAAFDVINELNGKDNWIRQRAQDKKDLGDPTLLEQLLTKCESVRARSGEMETEAAALTYDDLLAYDPLAILRQFAGL